MKGSSQRSSLWQVSVCLLALVCAWLAAPAARAQDEEAATTAATGVWAATGTAWSPDAKDVEAKGEFAALGMLAARNAKKACAGREPDLVLVFAFHWRSKTEEDRQQIMAGVAESFDKKMIYGMSSGLAGDLGGERRQVTVLVLGGVKHTTVMVPIEKGNEQATYAALAEGLKTPYEQAPGKGRLVLIVGSCAKTSRAPEVVKTFQSVLGDDVVMFGPGVPHSTQYAEGGAQENTLTAILVTGDFKCDFAIADAGLEPDQEYVRGQDNAKILESSQKAIAAALGDKKDDVAAVLVESCESRGHSLQKEIEEPVAAKAAEGVPAMLFVWSYGYEIGHAATGEPAIATKSRVIACVIRRTSLE